MSKKILIIDDDPQIREVVRIGLEQAGYATLTAGDGAAGLALVGSARPDLVVLDIGLPEMDGFEVCRRLRVQSQVPVLFLSARDEELDRVLGFEMGADDYVTKPFSPRELVARVKAILKRVNGAAETGGQLSHGELQLDTTQHLCLFRGAPVALTASEMALLAHLVRHPAQVAARPALTDAMYGANSQVSDRTVDSHLRNLRRKLAEAGCTDAVETVHGIGVRMGPCRG
ncbi:response regulator transcription factor [Profundibacter sp.]